MLTAYASGAANPVSSQSDYIVNLNGGDTIPTTAGLFGGGVDSNDPSAVFSFSWTLLRRPPTSNAALSDSAVQNPTLGAVDVWGNYLLFLIVTNQATGETSETDPIAAPSTAFVSVRVQSLELGLEKPSAGERGWNSRAWAWVDAIEDHEDRVDALEALSQVFALNDLGDVTLGTLTSGEALVYNGVNWENGDAGSTLAIHDAGAVNVTNVDLVDQALVLVSDSSSIDITHGTSGSNPKLSLDVTANLTVDTLGVNGELTVNADDTAANPVINMLDGSTNAPAITYDTSSQEFKIKRTTAEGYKAVITEADIASSTEYGVARVETTSTSYNTTGKILDVERLIFSASVDGMVDYKSATQHAKTGDNDVVIEEYDAANYAQHAALVFKNVTGEEIGISDISLVMASAGISSVSEYAFSFVVYSSLADLAANTASTTYALPTFNRIGDNQAGECSFNYVSHNASTPLTVAAGRFFRILVTSAPDYSGNRLQCTMQGFRLIS